MVWNVWFSRLQGVIADNKVFIMTGPSGPRLFIHDRWHRVRRQRLLRDIESPVTSVWSGLSRWRVSGSPFSCIAPVSSQPPASGQEVTMTVTGAATIAGPGSGAEWLWSGSGWSRSIMYTWPMRWGTCPRSWTRVTGVTRVTRGVWVWSGTIIVTTGPMLLLWITAALTTSPPPGPGSLLLLSPGQLWRLSRLHQPQLLSRKHTGGAE